MFKVTKAVFVTLLFFSISSIAAEEVSQESRRTWTKHIIPGAKCGNGDAYPIFISKGNPEKLAFSLEGGGACWSKDSCFGLIKYTSLSAPDKMSKNSGFYSTDPRRSAVHDHTLIHFPYCTGDVHSGTHTADYGGRTVNHFGRLNFEKAMKYLDMKFGGDWADLEKVVVYGPSAGALGALSNSMYFDNYFSDVSDKVLLLDGAGLHWGKTFWHKFTDELLDDYSVALGYVGFVLNIDEGMIASIARDVCSALPAWNVGFMQGSRDFVMTTIFGDISAAEHHRLVYGNNGLYELTKAPNDNCSAWVPNTSKHTFYSKTKNGPTPGGVSVEEYVRRVTSMGAVSNFK